MNVEVEHDESRRRFVADLEGSVGHLDYDRVDSGTLDFKHTFVPRDRRGRGLGGRIVERALSHAREHGYRVVPSCPFVRRYVDRHPEFADVILDP